LILLEIGIIETQKDVLITHTTLSPGKYKSFRCSYAHSNETESYKWYALDYWMTGKISKSILESPKTTKNNNVTVPC
jgi:hypothetical protein